MSNYLKEIEFKKAKLYESTSEFHEKSAIYDYFHKYLSYDIHDTNLTSKLETIDSLLVDMIRDSRISVESFLSFISTIVF